MNNLILIFFALPLAVVIVSIALQKLFDSPALVAGIIFVVFLVATFIIGDLNILILAIAYAILAYITAVLTRLVHEWLQDCDRRKNKSANSNLTTNVIRKYA